MPPPIKWCQGVPPPTTQRPTVLHSLSLSLFVGLFSPLTPKPKQFLDTVGCYFVEWEWIGVEETYNKACQCGEMEFYICTKSYTPPHQTQVFHRIDYTLIIFKQYSAIVWRYRCFSNFCYEVWGTVTSLKLCFLSPNQMPCLLNLGFNWSE